jgi:hypothetical protein
MGQKRVRGGVGVQNIRHDDLFVCLFVCFGHVSRTFTSRLVSRLARVAASFGVSFFLNKSIMLCVCWVMLRVVVFLVGRCCMRIAYSWCSVDDGVSFEEFWLWSLWCFSFLVKAITTNERSR